MINLTVRAKSQSTVERLLKSRVQSEKAALSLVHHATRGSFDASDMAPFTHFGTREAARQRSRSSGEVQDTSNDGRLISAFLDIQAPLMLDDVDDDHNVEHFVELIHQVIPQMFSPGDMVELYDMETGQAEEFLCHTLLENGYDGICYINHHEDPGSLSWVILDPVQAIIQRDGPLAGSRDPWELSEEEFTGPLIESDVFEIDGHAEDYVHLWEDLEGSAADLPILAAENGWEARWLPDWEPLATMGLFDPSGTARGFYMGGQLWIDADARGSGRSALLINAAADLLGGCPAQNRSGMGFSAAGAAAHRSARRKAIHTSRDRVGHPDLIEHIPAGDDDLSTSMGP